MSGSVARRVAAGGVAVLATTLLAVGGGTGAVLHAQRRRALDEALLAAAHGRAHPDVAGEVEVEHSRSPVETWLVGPDDPLVPAALARDALRRERPTLTDVGDVRLVLLPFEVEQGDDEHEREAEGGHGLAAAAAPRVTLGRSVGAFAAVYGALALGATLLAGAVQVQVVRRAFRPLDVARDEAARVMALGADARLTAAGPTELRAFLEAINDLLARLEAAHLAQARFTAEAAHELRTPVAAMLGVVEVALRGAPSVDECRAALASARQEAVRLRRLVDGLTALARIDAGQVDGGRELVRAAELAASALAAERATLEEARVPVRVVVDADPELEVHRPLVEAALANLLRNAARHAPGAEVVLRVAAAVDGAGPGGAGERAVFEVDDGGPGVPPDEREALFDRFARRGEARRRDREGLGLGLPIAREVARRHGGDCVLETSSRGGVLARLSVRAKAAR